MNRIKSHLKKARCIRHREERYLRAINGLIDGKFNPNYVTYRWSKLHSIKDSR